MWQAVLNRKVSVVRQPVSYLDVSILQRLVLSQAPGLQQLVLHLDMSVSQCSLDVHVSVYKSFVLRLEVSVSTACAASVRVLLCCTWTCLSTRARVTPVRYYRLVGYTGWRAGTKTLCHGRLYPPLREKEFG